jgi:hypothetical protein
MAHDLTDIDLEINKLKVKCNRAMVCGHAREVTALQKEYEWKMAQRDMIILCRVPQQWVDRDCGRGIGYADRWYS